MQHEKPELMELGLESMHALICILKESPETATNFYQFFYAQIMKETLAVMVDYRHMSGFKQQAQIIQLLIEAVESNQIINPQVRINTLAGQAHSCESNKAFVIQLLKELLIEMFANLNQV